MRPRTHGLLAALFAAALQLAVPPNLWALQYSQAKIIIEVNASAGDGGIQIFLDAEGWNRLEITDPNREVIFSVGATGSVGMTGVTELFFESAEPSFEDLPLEDLLERFPAGTYRFAGTTTDGKQLSGRPVLSHRIPAAPAIASPTEDAALNADAPIAIDWNPVTTPYPGTTLPVVITGYQVIVERVKPTPLQQFSVFVPASVTKVTVPAEFLQTGAEYIFEVLAIEEGGNQTITEGSFTTTGGGNREDKGRASEKDALGVRGASFLRQNYPNPFNPATTLDFALPRESVATVRVLDVHGRLVRTLVSGRLPAGSHRATWDGNDMSGRAVGSGVYVVELASPDVKETRKIVLSR